MKTESKIETLPAPSGLKELTHANLTSSAAGELKHLVSKIERQGAHVLSARGRRSSVPNSYGPTGKMNAPFWKYYGESRSINAEETTLESRPYGSSIKPVIVVKGADKKLLGFRCFVRDYKNDIAEFREID